MTQLLPILLAAAVASVVLGLLLLIRNTFNAIAGLFRPKKRESDDGPSLVEVYRQSRKPTGWFARLDQSFSDMINRTLLGIDAGQAAGIIAVLGLLLAGGLYFWQDNLIFAIGGLVLGMAVPFVTFVLLRHRWRRKLADLMPDSFFLLARSLRAGLSLEQALELIGQQGPAPLAEEYRRVSDQVKLGLPIPNALKSMSHRVQVSDFNILVSVIEMHRRVGGNLTALLDRMAIGTRERNQYRGQFRAATALGRATAVLIALGSPVLLLIYWILQPEFLIRFVQTPMGIGALVVAAILEVVGVVWIWYLLRIDY